MERVSNSQTRWLERANSLLSKGIIVNLGHGLAKGAAENRVDIRRHASGQDYDDHEAQSPAAADRKEDSQRLHDMLAHE